MGPKPPNAADLADKQQQINKDTANSQFQFGAVDQVTPGGSLTYTQNGVWEDGTPKYQATQSLSGQSQNIYDSLMGAAGQAAGNISNPIATPNYQTSLDTSGLSALPTAGDYSADRQRVEDSLFARINPQLQSARQSREADLINRGVRPGTAAYDRAMNQVGQTENDARLQTVLAGGQEQSRMFGDALAGRSQGYNEALQTGMFGNAALGQGFQDSMQARSQPINEIGALFGGTQLNQPNYVNTPQPGVAGTDYAGMAQTQYGQQQQRRSNILSGLFGLGSSLVGGLFG